MAIKGKQLSVNFYAFDTSNNQPSTGQAGNINAYIVKDGGAPSSSTNSVSEPSNTNMPGIYELVLTSTEMDADFITVGGSVPANTGIIVYPTMVATEGDYLVTLSGYVDELENRLTSARAGYLDNLNGHTPQTGDSYAVVTNGAYGLSVIEAYVDELESRLTAARASYLDNLNGHTPQTGDSYAEVTSATYGLSIIEGLVDDLESRLTSARAGYLDNLNISDSVASDTDVNTALTFLNVISGYVDDLENRLTSARAGYLDNLNGHTAQTGDSYAVVTNGTYGLSALESLVDDLETRLTSARASYLDNLSGHVPQTGDSYSELTNVTYGLSAINDDNDDLLNRLTSARAGYLDNLNIGGDVASDSDMNVVIANLSTITSFVDELESRLTAARAGYLDNLNISGNVASQSSVDSLPSVTQMVDGVYNKTLDGVTASGIHEIIMAYVTGKIWKDGSDIWHYYKQDGATEIFATAISGDYRIRDSESYS